MTIPGNYQPKYKNKVTYRLMKSIYNSVSLYIRPPQPVAREQHVARDIVFVMLPAQTFEMKKTPFNPFSVTADRPTKQF